MNLGERLFELRKAKNLTQDDVAEKLNVSRQTVSKWETGRGLPDISLLGPLAQSLGISIPELLSGETITNRNRTANILRSKFYACPVCGNTIHATGEAMAACCGITLPPLAIYLHKAIPDGAGLGGGSADASFALKAVNELLSLGLSDNRLAEIAAKTGADCPFFIYNRPMLAQGIGQRLSPVEIPSLNGRWITIVKPSAEAVATPAAYAGVTPCELPDGICLNQYICRPAQQWHTDGILVNDFEPSIFALRPVIADTLARLRSFNPVYSAMSGSGASLFAIFDTEEAAAHAAASFPDCVTFCTALNI